MRWHQGRLAEMLPMVRAISDAMPAMTSGHAWVAWILAEEGDLEAAVKTAVINKRAGGTGLISGRKAFQRPLAEGVGLLNAIQDVYLDKSVTVA